MQPKYDEDAQGWVMVEADEGAIVLSRELFDDHWELWKETWPAGTRKSRAYWQLLQHWEDGRFRRASRDCMATCERFPSIGDVIKRMPLESEAHWRLDSEHQPIAQADLAAATTYRQTVQGWRDAYVSAAETGELINPFNNQVVNSWPVSDNLTMNFAKLARYAEAHIRAAERRVNKLKPQGDIPF